MNNQQMEMLLISHRASRFGGSSERSPTVRSPAAGDGPTLFSDAPIPTCAQSVLQVLVWRVLHPAGGAPSTVGAPRGAAKA